jgi:peptide methionine sulfoxide reductase msrA/msrB
MKIKYISIGIFTLVIVAFFVVKNEAKKMPYRKLTPEEKRVIIDKGTEAPYSGKYLNNTRRGTYTCKRCGAPLYRSTDKFDSHCGWPSFDDEIPGAVKRVPDPDGQRTEIICANCGAHLGHVFTGEGLTKKNIRHCVNSISLVFVPDPNDPNTPGDPNQPDTSNAPKEPNEPTIEKAYFAGGCFWGVEYWFQKNPGVISVTSGYMGGDVNNPSYGQVCTGRTGHAETVEVVFDPNKTTYEDLAKLFFDIHDPTQLNRQGPDIGLQYRSAIFYTDAQQKQIAEKLIEFLKEKGLKVVTSVEPAKKFWPAEKYHQDYYFKKGGTPYCHIKVNRF